MGGAALPWIERAERYIRPRWLILTAPPVPMLYGLVIAALAVVLVLPVPLVNFPPAVALLCLSLGIVERDGVLILVGLVAAAFALALGGAMALFAFEAARLALSPDAG